MNGIIIYFNLGRDVFELVECRHPIVEYLPFAPTFIPNNVSFGMLFLLN
jgi:DNA mismatch repair ATPase MutS